MSTSANTITTYFALLALACNAFVIAIAVAWVLRRRVPELWNRVTASLGPSALTVGAVIALVATAGSLYLSEGAHFVPCRLCWYQRIGMYPLAVVLPIAAIRRDRRVWPYPLALALGALPISIYHVLLEHFPSLETGACDVNNPCSIVWVRHFGFVTIPYMAASGFVAIAVLMAIAAVRPTKEISHVSSQSSRTTTPPEPATQPDLRGRHSRPRRGRGRRRRPLPAE